MKAFIVDQYKKPEARRIGEIPVPELAGDDVLVKVHAASINPLDSKIASGEFKLILPYRTPFVLGHDLAGVVEQVGTSVRRFKPGDAVYGRARDGRIGTFAEFIAVNEADLAPKPANLTMEEAASIPLVGLTAWQVLVERARVKAGDKVLIHAGSGGFGTIAIQLAKHLGAEVATTASTSNLALVKSLGADVAVDYKTEQFEKKLDGYDVVINTLDKTTLEKSVKVLKPGGQLISISGPPDASFAKDNNLSPLLGFVMRGLSYGIRRQARKHGVCYAFHFMHAGGAQLERLTPLLERGAIRPVIDRIFPFAQITDALAYTESGHAKGKVVVSTV
jgi:NADPH:quinone reductase-like Zn-dependent oxidoreductase